jgi:hypothetical protein
MLTHDDIARGQTFACPMFGTVKVTNVEERAIYFKLDTGTIHSLSIASFLHLFA